MEKRKGKFNGKKYACIHNLQGDVMGLRDAAGTEVVCHIYDAWNKLLSTTGSMAASLGYLNPFRYRGYVNDEETGLHYLKSSFITTNRATKNPATIYHVSRNVHVIVDNITKTVIQISNTLDGNWMPDISIVE